MSYTVNVDLLKRCLIPQLYLEPVLIMSLLPPELVMKVLRIVQPGQLELQQASQWVFV